jgi:Tfp pilus assembly protein PilZ
MAQLSADSRKDKRKPVNVTIEFKGKNKGVVAITQNLSLGGMFVSTKEPLEVSKKGFFRISAGTTPVSFNFEGEVVWNNGRGCRSNRRDLPQGMGVRFLDSNTLKRDAITSFINFIEESAFRLCV